MTGSTHGDGTIQMLKASLGFWLIDSLISKGCVGTSNALVLTSLQPYIRYKHYLLRRKLDAKAVGLYGTS